MVFINVGARWTELGALDRNCWKRMIPECRGAGEELGVPQGSDASDEQQETDSTIEVTHLISLVERISLFESKFVFTHRGGLLYCGSR